MSKILKKMLKIAAAGLGLILLILLSYFAYLLLSYKRLPDELPLAVTAPLQGEGKVLQRGESYGALTYNIGFGAYTPEFSFFMDGGKYSVAADKESVIRTVEGAAMQTLALKPDIVLIQEMDINGTRSHHVDESVLFREKLREYYQVFALNYDSAYLFYPFSRPHGKNKSGIASYSLAQIQEAKRRRFPIATSLKKFLDLDRCYSIAYLPVEEGRQLALFNVHMSAYGNDASIREAQLRMLFADMQAEYDKGNYVLCGGDFNHELKETESEAGEYRSWAHPFPKEDLPEDFYFGLDTLSEEERAALLPSSRNADIPYTPGVSEMNTLDGFILSRNIECLQYETVDTGFLYSDHEPVYLRFILH